MSYHLTIPMLAGECWWGGTIKDAERMPFDEHTQYHVDLLRERRTQSAPLFLSSKGRYLWSEGAFAIEMDGGVMEIPFVSWYEFMGRRKWSKRFWQPAGSLFGGHEGPFSL